MFTPLKDRSLPAASLVLAAAGMVAGIPARATSFEPASAQAASAQGTTAANPGAVANRLLGAVTGTAADSLTIKLESGAEVTISITPQTRLLRTAPGEKTLKGATAIQLSDLANGDRVLVLRPTPGADATHYGAAAVVAMKQADIAQAHASESEDWQRRGVGGIVKAINPAASGGMAGATTGAASGSGDATSTIVLGTTQPGHSLAISVTPATIIRRYADDSINFADSRPATLADIHPGDQLRARGEQARTSSGPGESSEVVTAVEIVAGSFRNVAGTIIAIDVGQNRVTMTDLATKKPVTLKLTAETQMRKLPPEMAQRLAARSGGQGAGGQAGGSPGGQAGSSPGGQAGSSPGGQAGSGQAARSGAAAGSAGAPPAAGNAAPAQAGETGAGAQGRTRGDAASMLQRAPTVTLAELKKGDALMVVASRSGGGAADAATAITLIAGVEPLLESSAGSASQNLFSASWNLGGGGAEAAAAQ